MFNLFKKKSEVDILRSKYEKLMKEAYEYAKINRTESDQKYAEADSVMNQIQRIQKDNS